MSANTLCRRLASIAVCPNNRTLGSSTEIIRSIHTSQPWDKNRLWPAPKHMDKSFCRIRLPRGTDLSKYTIKPIETAKTGGRGPDGKIWIHRIGGGLKKTLRMVDYHRDGPKEGQPLVEKVYEVRQDDFSTAHIALVASGNKKRWIVASNNIGVGDLIKTSGELTSMPVAAQEGDAYPVGSLPVGTLMHCIERVPGEGGMVARAAGCSGVFVRKVGDKCVVRMPSKHEVILHPECMVVVGQVSNVEWLKEGKPMTCAKDARLRGIRPKSGWTLKKTGYAGRKIRALPPPKVIDGKPDPRPVPLGMTFKNWRGTGNY